MPKPIHSISIATGPWAGFQPGWYEPGHLGSLHFYWASDPYALRVADGPETLCAWHPEDMGTPASQVINPCDECAAYVLEYHPDYNRGLTHIELDHEDPIWGARGPWEEEVETGWAATPSSRTIHHWLWQPESRIYVAACNSVEIAFVETLLPRDTMDANLDCPDCGAQQGEGGLPTWA